MAGASFSHSVPGTQINADLDNEWDIDWYKVDIASAGTWKKYMLGGGNGYAASNYGMVLVNSNLEMEAASVNGEMEMTFHRSGTYFLGVFSKNWSTNSSNQQYSVTQTENIQGDFNLNTASIKYNDETTKVAIAGGTNTLQFNINKKTAASSTSTTYYAEAWLSWDNNNIYKKVGAVITLTGTTQITAFINNTNIGNSSGDYIYTRIRIFKSYTDRTLLYESESAAHSVVTAFNFNPVGGGTYLFTNNPETIAWEDLADYNAGNTFIIGRK